MKCPNCCGTGFFVVNSWDIQHTCQACTGTGEIMDEFRVIVAGGRDFNNFQLLEEALNFYLKDKRKTHKIIIISGEAKGADTLGEKYAGLYGLKTELYPAKWDVYGRSAGYRRNKEMGITANAAIVFWDGSSRGSKHMIDIMEELNKPCRVVNY